MALLVGFACALLLCALIIPLILHVAHRNKIFARKDERTIHSGNIPRLGGVGIFLSFAASMVLVSLLFGTGARTGGHFWAVMLSMLIVHLVGLVDDFRDLRALLKFGIELILATGLAWLGFRFTGIPSPLGGGPLELGALSYALTVLWIIGITNALNLIDGMDGLAGGISAFAAATYGVIFLVNGNAGAALACFVLVGAIFGFLAFNLPPAKVFMGDSGALFLGFALSILPLIGSTSAIAGIGIVSAITILLIPIYDTFSAIIRRRRAGLSPFTPDKLHLHHKLMALGLDVKGALLVIYGAQAGLCLVALSALVLPLGASILLNIGAWLLYAALFYALGVTSKRCGIRAEPAAVLGSAADIASKRSPL